MGLTIAQKIIKEHLVSGDMTPGSEIALRIDQTLTQDATGTMAYLEFETMGVPRVKTELSVAYIDHNTLQSGFENADDHRFIQSMAKKYGLYFSRPGNGICHQVHLERFGKPGKTLIGSDSHTPTGGGIGMLAMGAGGLDVAVAMGGGAYYIPYPKATLVKLSGALRPMVSAKDVILEVLRVMSVKGGVGKIVEYGGEGVKNLTVPQRATITNMGAELGATTSIFPSDEVTHAFLKAQGREEDYMPLAADADAVYDEVIEIDLSALEPLAACPHSPDNVKPVRSLSMTKVDQVCIGSCTNSSYADLMTVAEILKGKTVSPEVSLAIAPGSRQVLEMLARNGMLADIIASGARILETGCGPCIGQGQSPADDTVSVRTFNRNFAGRTGTKGDQAYLVSPETAVAIALTGEFTDPRTAGIEYPNVVEPEVFEINDNMIQLPGGSGEIVRKRTIGAPPVNQPLPDELDGVVVIKVGDKITTDHIMPAGIHLKHRSNIPVYAKVVFECFNEAGRPTFAERASAVRDSGKAGIIVGRDSYGQGSSREHAAICPMYLGVKVVAALAIERIHSANLVNFGIVPLVFANPADYDSIGENDSLVFHSLRGQLRPGEPVRGELTKADGTKKEIVFNHRLSAEDIRIILAGGMLNL